MLRHKIGTLAGKIWQFMDDSKKGEISTKELIDNNGAEIEKMELYMALGWLACENKIAFEMKEDQLIVFLIY